MNPRMLAAVAAMPVVRLVVLRGNLEALPGSTGLTVGRVIEVPGAQAANLLENGACDLAAPATGEEAQP